MTSALLYLCPTYPNNRVIIKESLSNYKSAVMKHFPALPPRPVWYSWGFTQNSLGVCASFRKPFDTRSLQILSSHRAKARKKKRKKNYFKFVQLLQTWKDFKYSTTTIYHISWKMWSVSQLSLQTGAISGGGFRDQLALVLFYTSVFSDFFYFFLTVDIRGAAEAKQTHSSVSLTHTHRTIPVNPQNQFCTYFSLFLKMCRGTK